jgi:translocation and assembly module TamB
MPAAVANSFAPELGAEGTVFGSGGSSPARRGCARPPPSRRAGQGASVGASRNAGLGRAGHHCRRPAGGHAVNAHEPDQRRGRAGLAGRRARSGTATAAPLDLRLTGAAPLSLGNRQLASRGRRLNGELDIDLGIGGTAAAPVFSGRSRPRAGAMWTRARSDAPRSRDRRFGVEQPAGVRPAFGAERRRHAGRPAGPSGSTRQPASPST